MFSIIIPIHNSESTLDRCLQSIQVQTDTDFEAILVDDGSADRSAEICRSYLSDSRFRLITQENSGPSAARNAGLDVATGDYIAFVDSDDYVDPIYIEQIRSCFQEQQADVVLFGAFEIGMDEDVISSMIPPLKKGAFIDQLMELSRAGLFGYVWNKAFKSKVLNTIRFDETAILFEDEIFVCAVFKQPIHLRSVNQIIYYHIQHDDSLSARTRHDYAAMCDQVFCAWRELLPTTKEGQDNLRLKAEHYLNNCYYYVMERNVELRDFCRTLLKTDFFCGLQATDTFSMKIKKRQWMLLRWEKIMYCLKNRIATILRKWRASYRHESH